MLNCFSMSGGKEGYCLFSRGSGMDVFCNDQFVHISASKNQYILLVLSFLLVPLADQPPLPQFQLLH